MPAPRSARAAAANGAGGLLTNPRSRVLQSLAELQSRVDATEGSGTLVAEEDLRSTAEKLGYGGVK